VAARRRNNIDGSIERQQHAYGDTDINSDTERKGKGRKGEEGEKERGGGIR